MKPAREPNVFCYNSWRVFDIPFGIYFRIKNRTDMQVGGWKWKFTLYHYSWSLNPQKVLCWKRRTYIPILRINNTAGIYHQKLTNLALLMSHAIICSLLVRVTEASFSSVLGSIKRLHQGTLVYCTTRNLKFAEYFYVCRVHSIGHSVNKFFAECYPKNTRQKKNTRQRWGFAECQTKNTRQIGGHSLQPVKERWGGLGHLPKIALLRGKVLVSNPLVEMS